MTKRQAQAVASRMGKVCKAADELFNAMSELWDHVSEGEDCPDEDQFPAYLNTALVDMQNFVHDEVINEQDDFEGALLKFRKEMGISLKPSKGAKRRVY